MRGLRKQADAQRQRNLRRGHKLRTYLDNL